VAIDARRKIVNDGCAFGDSAEHSETMTYRLVAGHGYGSGDFCGRPDFQTIHIPEITTSLTL
jgi:hypothetical protein